MQGWSCVSYLCTIVIGHSDIIVVIVFLKPSQWSYYISAQKNWNCSELDEFQWFIWLFFLRILLILLILVNLAYLAFIGKASRIQWLQWCHYGLWRWYTGKTHKIILASTSKLCNFPTFVRPHNNCKLTSYSNCEVRSYNNRKERPYNKCKARPYNNELTFKM